MPEGVAPPERSRRPQPRAGAETRDNAFLNVPYDRRYERLYLAFIAGLSVFGLALRATVELAGSQRRLDRIVRLLRSCSFPSSPQHLSCRDDGAGHEAGEL
jgi:hypothetical protein